VHLGHGPGVDAVQNAGPQRLGILVGGQKAGADAADRHPGDLALAVGRFDQFVADRLEVGPPDRLGVVLGPARPGQRQVVGVLREGHHLAVQAHQHALGRAGADVDSDQQFVGHEITLRRVMLPVRTNLLP
jgi:hypothetical protein